MTYIDFSQIQIQSKILIIIMKFKILTSFQTGEFNVENRIKYEKYWKEKIKHQDLAAHEVSTTNCCLILSFYIIS